MKDNITSEILDREDSGYISFQENEEANPLTGSCSEGEILDSPPISREIVFPAWENIMPLLRTFVENISIVQNNRQRFDVIPCIYPSQSMARILMTRNNFGLEYNILFNDQIVTFLVNIIEDVSTLRNYINDSTSESLREGISNSLISSRDSILDIYLNIFNNLPQIIIENNIFDHFQPIFENLAQVDLSDLLSFQISAFLLTTVSELPPEQWQLFLESILTSSGINGSSVHHYHMMFSAWSAEPERINYEDFQTMLLTSAEFYKKLNSSFYGSSFNAAVLTEVSGVATTAIEVARISTAATLTNLTGISNEIIGDISTRHVESIQNIPTSLDFSSWDINSIFSRSAFLLASGGVFSAAMFYRVPILDWYRNLYPHPVNMASHWQDLRLESITPIEITDEIRPVIPTLLEIPGVQPILDNILPSLSTLGIMGGMMCFTVVVIRNNRFSRLIRIMSRK